MPSLAAILVVLADLAAAALFVAAARRPAWGQGVRQRRRRR